MRLTRSIITKLLIVSIFTTVIGYQSVIDICISKYGYATQYWVDGKIIQCSFLLLRFYVYPFKSLVQYYTETQIKSTERLPSNEASLEYIYLYHALFRSWAKAEIMRELTGLLSMIEFVFVVFPTVAVPFTSLVSVLAFGVTRPKA